MSTELSPPVEMHKLSQLLAMVLYVLSPQMDIEGSCYEQRNVDEMAQPYRVLKIQPRGLCSDDCVKLVDVCLREQY